MKILSLCIPLLLVANIEILSQQRTQDSYPIRVKLSISGDEIIKGELQSFLGRELRSLTDVSVVDKDADYEIGVLAIEVFTVEQKSVGYAMAINVMKPLKAFRFIVGEQVAPYDSSFCIFLVNWIRTGGKDDLKRVCESVVADFDNQILEPGRKKK